MSDFRTNASTTINPEFSHEIIAALDVEHSDSVTVVGLSQVGLLIELCRVGVKNAACRAPAPLVCGTDGPATVVLAPALGSETELRQILAGLARALCPGGTLAIRVSRPLPFSRLSHWRSILRDHGYALRDSTKELSDGSTLMFARKRLEAVVAKAA